MTPMLTGSCLVPCETLVAVQSGGGLNRGFLP